MKVAFLITGFGACQFYRMVQPAGEFPGAELVMAGHGIDGDVIERAARADVVQMSRVCRTAEIEAMRALRRRGVVVALDYDDNLLIMAREQVLPALREADLLTVSTRTLATAYHRVAPTLPWAVMPNRIDTQAWWRAPRPPSPAVVIAYAGSPSHREDFLRVAAPAVWDVMRDRQHAVLRVIGCAPFRPPEDVATRVEQRIWVDTAQHREAIMALNADIAIAPLVQCEFNDGRSELKWLQFAAQGVPMVASFVGAYPAAIDDTRTGFLAVDRQEWHARLLALVDSASLRRTIGANACAEVAARYDIARDAATRTAAYQQALDRKRSLQRSK